MDLSVGKIQERRDFLGMGFMDKRRKRPDKLWALLQLFALNHGEIDFSAKELPLRHRHIKAQIKDIRKRLIHLFQINGDPFEDYRKVKAYKTKFTIGSEENESIEKEISEDESFEEGLKEGKEEEAQVDKGREDNEDQNEGGDKEEEEDY